MDKQSLIRDLRLSSHPEGGYYRRTYESSRVHFGRRLMSSIFYLLTDDQPIGYLHRNRSDIVHYWQAGGSIRFTLLTSEGKLLQPILGPNLEAGEQLQLTVPGGFWKASELLCGDFGLISEAVNPGFDFDDHDMANAEGMRNRHPQHWQVLNPLCKP